MTRFLSRLAAVPFALAAATAAIVALAAPTARAQGPAGPPEALGFSLVAPDPAKVTLTAWDGVVHVDNTFDYVPGPVSIDWTRTNLDWRFLWGNERLQRRLRPLGALEIPLSSIR